MEPGARHARSGSGGLLWAGDGWVARFTSGGLWWLGSGVWRRTVVEWMLLDVRS